MGLGGADAECDRSAAAASLPGRYRAWLSTSAAAAPTRLGSASGWIRPDGRPFALSRTALLANAILYPPRLDERGEDVGAAYYVATGTRADLTSSPYTAADWTTSSDFLLGHAVGGSGVWTDSTKNGAGQGHLYCFGIDGDTSPPPLTAPAGARFAFVTASSYVPADTPGIAKADELCNREASMADPRFRGSYLALLATTTTAAADRFDTAGAPWVRPDGVPVLTQAADLRRSPPDLVAAINVQLDGSYVRDGVYTGAADPTTPAAVSTSCRDWAPSGGADLGTTGLAQETDADAFGFYAQGCARGARIYCLQQ
jgi:hypothetical protein